LATLRIALGGYGLFYVLGRMPALLALGRDQAGAFRPVGPVSILEVPLPTVLHMIVVVATVVAGVAFVAGARFRVSGPAFAVLLAWVLSYRNSWGMVFHTENLLVLHVLVLGLTRSADALAFDARGKPVAEPHARYGWAITLLCTLTAATYFIAGVTKLRHAGLDWVWSDTLRNMIAFDNVRKIELGAGYSEIGAFLVRYDALFPPLAAFSLLVELGAPLALLGPRIGRWWCALAWGFHLGVLAVMFIFFHYPLLGFAYAPFFPVEKLAGLRILSSVRSRRF
jgi:hypothetical protein